MVPVVGFVEVFLTEPAWGQGTEKANIYGEIKGILEPGESEAAHLIVLIYR